MEDNILNQDLIRDLKDIRESLRKINTFLEDDKINVSLKNAKLNVLNTQNKTLGLWITAIGSQAKLVQTNINLKENERLTERFTK